MMKLTIVNVGYGESLLIECLDEDRPGAAFTMLVDGGSGEEAEYAASDTGRIPVAHYLRERGIDHIDLLVSTHIHEDHICGMLPVVADLLPEVYWQTLPELFYRQMTELPESLAVNQSMGKFIRALNAYRALCIRVTTAGKSLRRVGAQAEAVPLCRHLTARLLSPSQAQGEALTRMAGEIYGAAGREARQAALARLDMALNNLSLILCLEYEGIRILLPGDANRDGFRGLEGKLGADLFKLGHHGQRDSVSPALLQEISPAYGVICASSDRRYNSAHPEVLKLLRDAGVAPVFSDCPEVAPYADRPAPHRAVVFEIGGGKIGVHYLGMGAG